MTNWRTRPGSGKTDHYDRREFYIRATNESDHYTTARVFSRGLAQEQGMPETIALPHEVVAQIKQMVDDPRTPYRSIQDMFRDAVRHRLHDLAEMFEDGNYLNFVNEEAYRQDLVRMEEEDEAWERTIKFYDERVDHYAQKNNPHGISDVIEAFQLRTPPLRLRMKGLRAVGRWERRLEEAEEKTR